VIELEIPNKISYLCFSKHSEKEELGYNFSLVLDKFPKEL